MLKTPRTPNPLKEATRHPESSCILSQIIAHLMTLLSASTLTHDSVVNARGEDLGRIEDFMLDLENGSISYAVLSFGGLLGIGDKYFAVPLEALRLDTANERFIMDVTKERLENAPGFDKDNWPAQPNRDFIDRVYSHYGFENPRRTRTTEPVLN